MLLVLQEETLCKDGKFRPTILWLSFLPDSSPYSSCMDKPSLIALSKNSLFFLCFIPEEPIAFLEVLPLPSNFSIIWTLYLALCHNLSLICSQRTQQCRRFLKWRKLDLCQFNLSFMGWIILLANCSWHELKVIKWNKFKVW